MSDSGKLSHDNVIKWRPFPRYCLFVRGIHPVNSPHKGQWRGALIFSLICVWINGWVNNRTAGDLRRHRAHYDVIVMTKMPLMHDDTQECKHRFNPEYHGVWCTQVTRDILLIIVFIYCLSLDNLIAGSDYCINCQSHRKINDIESSVIPV